MDLERVVVDGIEPSEQHYASAEELLSGIFHRVGRVESSAQWMREDIAEIGRRLDKSQECLEEMVVLQRKFDKTLIHMLTLMIIVGGLLLLKMFLK